MSELRTTGYWAAAIYITVSVLVNASAYAGPEHTADNLKENGMLERYLTSIESKKTGLFNSFLNTSEYIEDIRFPELPLMKMTGGYLDNQAFTYDTALCVMGLIDMGKIERAGKLLALLEDNFNVEKNGRMGLFNSMYTTHYDHFFTTREGRKNVLVMGIDGDRIHLGPNVWIGLCAQKHYYCTRSTAFIDFMISIYEWVKTLPHFRPMNDKVGAPCMGSGWGAPFEKIYAIENILDYYAFLVNMKRIMDVNDAEAMRVFGKRGVKKEEVANRIASLDIFFTTYAFNKRGTFNRGLFYPGDDGRCTVDDIEALDVNAWAIPGIGPEKLAQLGIDPVRLIDQTEIRFKVMNTVNGRNYEGFGFDLTGKKRKKRDEDMIWWEGTGEMVLAYRLIAGFLEKKGQNALANKYRGKAGHYCAEMNRFSKEVMISDKGELPYVAVHVGEKEMQWTFDDWWPIARASTRNKNGTRYSACISSTLWRYFAVMGIDPFNAREKRLGENF